MPSPYGINYKKARHSAFQRSDGLCQFCGATAKPRMKDTIGADVNYPSDAGCNV